MQVSTYIRESLYMACNKLLNRNDKKSKGENMNTKVALLTLALIILIIGVSCTTAIELNHNDVQHIKHYDAGVKEISNSSLKDVSVEKTSPATGSIKVSGADQIPKIPSQSNQVAPQKSSQKIEPQTGSADSKEWNPAYHEVSREDLGEGYTRIIYDDGYHRTMDPNGKIVSYGY